MTSRRHAFTLVEALVGFALIAVMFYAVFSLFRGGSRLARQEMEILGLQNDAQKSLVRFLRDLQEAMAVVLPQPGHTLPYAVVRDKRNRMLYYHLVPGSEDLMTLRREVALPSGSSGREILTGIDRLTFTSRSDGALRIHARLGAGGKDERTFSFLTQVRLRNREAASL